LVALGYAGWAPGQLEDEIQKNGWLTVNANLDLIFDVPPEARYDAAMQALGISAANLSEEAGHA
jgi:putative transcriptional regulator